MKQRPLIELPLAFALKRLIGPQNRRRSRPARSADPERTAAPHAASDAAPPQRGPLALVALVALIAGGALLIVFDAWFTRLIGVLGLFAFIVAGVFAIANPALLEQDDR